MINPTTFAYDIILKHQISEPDVKINKIIRSFGIQLHEVQLPDDISGLLNIEEDDSASILINGGHHKHRQKFTKAHELGHYLMHKQKGTHVDKNSFFFRSESIKGYHIIEIEANRFAAELLMPKHLIEQEIAKIGDDSFDIFIEKNIEDLATTFNVSQMAMSLRLEKLGYLNKKMW
jgi:Zn-dependent peptidase ImmA (M78 family)